MQPAEFLLTANDLRVARKREADDRSCISRGYYAVYQLLKVELLRGIPLAVLQNCGLGGKNYIAHERLTSVLRTSSNATIRVLGMRLDQLRESRVRADYN